MCRRWFRNKRLDVAAEACRRLGRRLMIIGRGPEARRLAALDPQHVQLLGWRSDEEVRDHLRRCRALLLPGREDFGIVPLEAQACGTPVIALGDAGATESVIAPSGDEPGTGIFFAEQSASSLASAIERFESAPHCFCPELARRNAERFHKDHFERALIEHLRVVVDAWSHRSCGSSR